MINSHGNARKGAADVVAPEIDAYKKIFIKRQERKQNRNISVI